MKTKNQEWFKDAKYGLFIHWGLYSILAGEYKGQKTDRIAEWIENFLDIPVEEYEKLAEQFNPTQFDADAFVKRAKEQWGMQYIVLTAKHHEGFAMYDSKVSDFNVVKATPYGKDILKQLQLACEKYGVRMGFYYSQAQDWDDPNGFMQHRDNSKKDFQKYLDEKCKPQVKELLENYGKICLIWFDTPMGITVDQTQELIDLVKSIQPDCLLSGRTGNHMGDYMTTGDNFIPRLPYDGYDGYWEIPATVNDTWGYNKYDTNWKSADHIISLLLKIVSRGGNYLLNVGPTADGVVPEACVEILNKVGKYVTENSEAIYGTKIVPIYPYEIPGIEFTRREHKLYVHVLSPRIRIELLNVGNQLKGAYIVSSKQQLEYRVLRSCEGDGMIEVDIPKELHEAKNYCVCLELVEEDPIFESIK